MERERGGRKQRNFAHFHGLHCVYHLERTRIGVGGRLEVIVVSSFMLKEINEYEEGRR